MAISRAQQIKQLVPGLNGLFGLSYNSYPEEHKEIFEMEKSDRSFEEEVKISGFQAAPVKAEGMGIAYDNAQETYTSRYNHETVALGFAITEEAMEDNLYESVSLRYTKALAKAMAYTKQIKAASVLNNGFSAQFVGGDGVPLFSTAHPLVNGSTNANTPVTPVDLNETALESAIISMGSWTDDRGQLIQAHAAKLIVPRELQFVATRLLETALRVGTNNNDVNALKNNGSVKGGWAINNFLTDPNAWFIKTDITNGLKMFERVALKTSMEGDFDTGNVRYKARERYSFGYSDPLGMWASPGA